MPRIYIGVGSNIEPVTHIPAAFDELIIRGVEVDASSRFYRTAAIGRPGQPPYANGVWRSVCTLGAQELRMLLRMVEEKLGRVRSTDKYAPRPIDLDILVYGDQIISDDELTIPDPHILERPFLARCLLEIDRGLVIPGSSVQLADVDPMKLHPLEDIPEITSLIRQRLESRK